MSRKKAEEQQDAKPRLKPAKYWEWRHSIAEMQLINEKAMVADLTYQNTLLKAKLQNFSISNIEQQKQQAKAEYEKIKASIEKEIGMSLNSCAIDDVTFEINKIE